MMKLLVLFLLVALASATPYQNQQASGDEQLDRQLKVLQLLERIHGPLKYQDIQTVADNYDPVANSNNYEEPEHAKALVKMVEDGKTLERNVYFSLFRPKHRREMICLFNLLRSAKDFDTFFKTAAWARSRLNEGLFSYGFIVALLHREDTKYIQIPPPYELNPHFFVSTEVIQEAYRAQMKQTPKTIATTFTGTKKNYEQRVAYFGEDVGMESHHFFWHADFPFWWNNVWGTKDRKGELFFYMHHQLNARFDAERLSNNLPRVEPLGWNKKIEEGFAPHATYMTEGEFPSRPDNMYFQDLPWVSRADMNRFESRIRDSIDRMELLGKDGQYININNTEGINYLGDIVEASANSINKDYYGSIHNLCHMLLSRITDPDLKYGLPPGVMEHFETSTRDPSFFRLHKYLDDLFRDYKSNLNPYTQEELNFPGVQIEALKVSTKSAGSKPNELKTYFQNFEFDLNNALDHVDNREDINIKASLDRLNYEPFTYTLNVRSEAAKKAVVRIFMSPKFEHYGEEIKLDDKRWQMIEMDKFVVKLNPGSNTITRESKDSSVTIPDLKSMKDLKSEVEEALNGDGDFQFNENFRHCGHPDRLLLPKGTKGGMDFVLVAMLSDAEIDRVQGYEPGTDFGGSLSYCGHKNEVYPDKRAMGFPWDRKIENIERFFQPNMKKADVKIFHTGKQ